MAKIFKTAAAIGGVGDFNGMQAFVNAYWGSEYQEKMFPIPFWQAIQMLDASESKEIALQVKDIANTTMMSAQWVAFDDALETAPTSFKPNYTYFVMDETLLESLKISVADQLHKVIIWGRIGKETIDTTTTYYAFFNVATCELVPPGGGGSGATTGARVPPNE